MADKSEVTFADVLREEERVNALPKTAKWDARWMSIAQAIAAWSKDPGHKVGAVLVNPATQTVISTGFNGYPRQLADVNLHDKPRKLQRTVHAEVNAILNAPPLRLAALEPTLYVAGLRPCTACAAVIIQSGVRRVVVEQPHNVHVVQLGDTLERIADEYNVGIVELCMLNPQIPDPDLIFPGERVNLFSRWEQEAVHAREMFREAGVEYVVMRSVP